MMKRSVTAVALFSLVLFAAACATTPATPSVRGVITQMNNGTIVVTPADGQATTINASRSTRIFWASGLEAGRSVLTVGQPVQVWLADGTQKATRIVIAQ